MARAHGAGRIQGMERVMPSEEEDHFIEAQRLEAEGVGREADVAGARRALTYLHRADVVAVYGEVVVREAESRGPA